MITTVEPLSADHVRALAMAYELQRLLGELKDRPEHGPGSSVELALGHIADAVGMLEPLSLEELGEDMRPTRDERRAAWRSMYGEEPPPNWPPGPDRSRANLRLVRS